MQQLALRYIKVLSRVMAAAHHSKKLAIKKWLIDCNRFHVALGCNKPTKKVIQDFKLVPKVESIQWLMFKTWRSWHCTVINLGKLLYILTSKWVLCYTLLEICFSHAFCCFHPLLHLCASKKGKNSITNAPAQFLPALAGSRGSNIGLPAAIDQQMRCIAPIHWSKYITV